MDSSDLVLPVGDGREAVSTNTASEHQRPGRAKAGEYTYNFKGFKLFEDIWGKIHPQLSFKLLSAESD